MYRFKKAIAFKNDKRIDLTEELKGGFVNSYKEAHEFFKLIDIAHYMFILEEVAE